MAVSDSILLTPEQHGLLLALIGRFLPDTQVWAFGSRVKGLARSSSDLDLLFFIRPEQRSQLFALHEALEESALPFRVDLLIWDEIPEHFRENIQQAYYPLVSLAAEQNH